MRMPDLILINANVITLVPRMPKAKQVAIRDGAILAVSDEDISKRLRQPQTRLIECRGNTLLPGFIDAYCHLWSTAERSICIDLSRPSRFWAGTWHGF